MGDLVHTWSETLLGSFFLEIFGAFFDPGNSLEFRNGRGRGDKLVLVQTFSNAQKPRNCSSPLVDNISPPAPTAPARPYADLHCCLLTRPHCCLGTERHCLTGGPAGWHLTAGTRLHLSLLSIWHCWMMASWGAEWNIPGHTVTLIVP